MKPILLLAVLVCSAFAPAWAHAAPPTDAQIDTLLRTMDMQRTLDEMYTQIDAMSKSMEAEMLGEDATPEQRESIRRIAEQQQRAMRDAMSWDKMAPIYRRIYGRVFTSEEVDAMLAFYGSDTGRGIMRKLPQVMQSSMEEMQPILRGMIVDLQKALETELQNTDGSVRKGDRKP